MRNKAVETTCYSLSSAAPAPPERRSGERHLSLLRVGALVVEGRRELCLIRNISAGGMMIRSYSHIGEGTRIAVELKHGESVSGVVRWSHDLLLGLAFDRQIDVLATLSPPPDGPTPRLPRIELECSALLRYEGQVHRVSVVNVSQGGVCISTPMFLQVHGDVVVTLPGLHSAAGVVKWHECGQSGIRFNRTFPVHELMGFLKDQQREEQQRGTVARPVNAYAGSMMRRARM